MHKDKFNNIQIDFGSTSFSTAVEKKYREILQFLNLDQEVKFFNCVIRDIVKPEIKVIDYFGGDFIGLIPDIPYFWEKKIIDEESYRDNFNVVWKKTGIYYEKFFYPLKEIDTDTFRSIQYEDELDENILSNLKKDAENIKNNSNKNIAFSYPSMTGLLSSAINLRGMEELFVDMYMNKDFYHKLMNNLVEIFISFYDKCLKMVGKNVDVIVFKDDLGTQSGEMISVDTYKEFIGPYHKKLFRNIKEKSEALVFYHSCGSIKKLIPELINSGIDILNPIQTSALNMDLFAIEKEFGKDLILWGGVDEQQLLSLGSKEAVKDEVRKILSYFENKGRYVFCASHVLQSDVPLENILTMYNLAKNFKN